VLTVVKFLEKIYVWSQKPKAVRGTLKRNIVKEKPGPKGNGCQTGTPLKSFEVFFDDAVN
jgi:hypothetical protein